MADTGQSKRCYQYASECLRLAQQARASQEKDLLLQMAETWRKLAERTETLWKPSPDRDAD